MNKATVGAGAAELPEPGAWLVTGEGIKSPQVYLDRQGAESHLSVRNCGVIVPLYAAGLGAVAVDAAPRRARKIGGSYQAEGVIVSEFKTTAGESRVVFEFDTPKGMLHIFNETQIERL